MRLNIQSTAARREALEALIRLPEHVRRVALEQVVFAGLGEVDHGQVIAGMALGPRSLHGTKWVVPLLEREGIGATLAHELAHVMAADETASAEAEIRATAQANAWGFEDGDPTGAAARFQQRQRRVRMRIRQRGDVLAVSCPCGTACRVYAPTAPGVEAHAGIECGACGWLLLHSLADLRPCEACGGGATVTWATDATPDRPRAAWACECGHKACLTIRPDPADDPDSPDMTPELWAAGRAASLLMRVEEELRSLSAVGDDHRAIAFEGCRSKLVLARQHMRRAGVHLHGFDRELALAGSELAESRFSDAADRVASVASSLNATTAGTPLKIGGVA